MVATSFFDTHPFLFQYLHVLTNQSTKSHDDLLLSCFWVKWPGTRKRRNCGNWPKLRTENFHHGSEGTPMGCTLAHRVGFPPNPLPIQSPSCVLPLKWAPFGPSKKVPYLSTQLELRPNIFRGTIPTLKGPNHGLRSKIPEHSIQGTYQILDFHTF